MKNNGSLAVGERLDGKPSNWARAVKYIKRNWILYLFVLPTIAWYIIFKYFPMPGVFY